MEVEVSHLIGAERGERRPQDRPTRAPRMRRSLMPAGREAIVLLLLLAVRAHVLGIDAAFARHGRWASAQVEGRECR